MMSLEHASYGAKIASFKTSNPRELLKRIHEESPGLDETALSQAFRDEIFDEENRAFLETAVAYTFKNAYVALFAENAQRKQSEQTRATAKTSSARVAAIKERIVAQVVLLHVVMPNGKQLAENTAADCKRAGGFYASLATKIPRGKTVSDVYSEAALRALWSKKPA